MMVAGTAPEDPCAFPLLEAAHRLVDDRQQPAVSTIEAQRDELRCSKVASCSAAREKTAIGLKYAVITGVDGDWATRERTW